MSINKVMISGNLTRDPELRATASGMAVLSFGVAVNDRRKNQQTGEWEDFPNFIDCTMFGARAESVSRFLSKGSKVFIEGKLRWSQWERDGQKRSKIEVIVDEIEFSGRGSQGAQPSNGQQGYQQASAQRYTQQVPVYQPPAQTQPAQPQMQQQPLSFYDDDIPF